MSALSQYARRSFAGAAAAVALASGISAPVQAQSHNQRQLGPAFHESCVPFESNPARAKSTYDEPLQLLINQLKDYSGWPAVRQRMKEARLDLDGLCPAVRTPPPIVPIPMQKGFAVNVIDPSTKRPIDPQKFSTLIKEGNYSISGAAINMFTSLSLNSKTLFTSDQDFNTAILLFTAIAAASTSENILLSVEAAAEDHRNGDLDFAYIIMPKLATEISDIHAQALVAKGQNRTLTQAERDGFRQIVFSRMLKDSDTRTNAAQQIFAGLANKLIEEARAGKPVALPALLPFSLQVITEKLKPFPGNLANAEVVKDYKSYWDARPEEDALKAIEKMLPNLPESARAKAREIEEQEKLQQSLPPGFIILNPS